MQVKRPRTNKQPNFDTNNITRDEAATIYGVYVFFRTWFLKVAAFALVGVILSFALWIFRQPVYESEIAFEPSASGASVPTDSVSNNLERLFSQGRFAKAFAGAFFDSLEKNEKERSSNSGNQSALQYFRKVFSGSNLANSSTKDLETTKLRMALYLSEKMTKDLRTGHLRQDDFGFLISGPSEGSTGVLKLTFRATVKSIFLDVVNASLAGLNAVIPDFNQQQESLLERNSRLQIRHVRNIFKDVNDEYSTIEPQYELAKAKANAKLLSLEREILEKLPRTTQLSQTPLLPGTIGDASLLLNAEDIEKLDLYRIRKELALLAKISNKKEATSEYWQKYQDFQKERSAIENKFGPTVSLHNNFQFALKATTEGISSPVDIARSLLPEVQMDQSILRFRFETGSFEKKSPNLYKYLVIGFALGLLCGLLYAIVRQFSLFIASLRAVTDTNESE